MDRKYNTRLSTVEWDLVRRLLVLARAMLLRHVLPSVLHVYRLCAKAVISTNPKHQPQQPSLSTPEDPNARQACNSRVCNSIILALGQLVFKPLADCLLSASAAKHSHADQPSKL
jgi:hypothetical protein